MTVAEIIEALGGNVALSAALGGNERLPSGTVAAWKSRGSIPPEYWFEIVEYAASIGRKDISYEMLAKMAAEKRPPLPPFQDPAPASAVVEAA